MADDAVTALREVLQLVAGTSGDEADAMVSALDAAGYHLTPIAPPQGELRDALISVVTRAYERGEKFGYGVAAPLAIVMEVERYLAAQGLRVVPGWQPIETAPKDGRMLLVAKLLDDGEAFTAVATWWANCWAQLGNMKIKGPTGHPIGMLPLDWEPTHWTPELPPPAAAPKGETPTTEPGSE